MDIDKFMSYDATAIRTIPGVRSHEFEESVECPNISPENGFGRLVPCFAGRCEARQAPLVDDVAD